MPLGSETRRRVIIAGGPNVGKSVLFGHLTGRYVAVSNYPGTTVEVTRGTGRWGGSTFDIWDTPGLYCLSCVTDEERVARRLLMRENPDWVVHVVDAKNLDRMLPLTFDLTGGGFRVLLVVNMMDEAGALGLEVDLAGLQARLGIPVVGTTLVRGEGVERIKRRLAEDSPFHGPPPRPADDPAVEAAISEVADLLRASYGLSRRAMAALCLDGDTEMLALARGREGRRWAEVLRVLQVHGHGLRGAGRRLAPSAHALARQVAGEVVRPVRRPTFILGEVLGDLLLRPAVGLPVLALVSYFGLYRLVGGVGAGVLVEALDGFLFLKLINPWATALVERVFASEALRSLLVGDYGLITLGLRYATAIVMPIVGTFFLIFSLLEDSGYLPRLALMVDRALKPLGLSGRAVIPLALGLGCGTMAVLVTRTLETRRERVLATFLLALAVPCSAQLGVVIGVLTGRPYALAVWTVVVGVVLLAAGTAAAALYPGRAAPFFIEVPPLRLPRGGNILRKTAARMRWYFRDVLPVFLAASVVIWLGQVSGVFPDVLETLAGIMTRLGLPGETAVVFLYGFLRRDYGAAGLYDLAPRLTTPALIVAAVTLTLFTPCLAQTVLMYRERGAVAATGILITVAVAALAAGHLLGRVLAVTGGPGW